MPASLLRLASDLTRDGPLPALGRLGSAEGAAKWSERKATISDVHVKYSKRQDFPFFDFNKATTVACGGVGGHGKENRNRSVERRVYTTAKWNFAIVIV